MGFKKQAPSFEERLNSAKADSAAALSVFDQIVADLESAASDKDAIALEVYAEAQRLSAVINDLLDLEREAISAATKARAKAEAVKALV